MELLLGCEWRDRKKKQLNTLIIVNPQHWRKKQKGRSFLAKGGEKKGGANISVLRGGAGQILIVGNGEGRADKNLDVDAEGTR